MWKEIFLQVVKLKKLCSYYICYIYINKYHTIHKRRIHTKFINPMANHKIIYVLMIIFHPDN
ncbi:hypothetical protein PFAG_01372 [Plasmodium falciparum Santa Lucia]|uniref:Uncharacterized protein n=3 Tax=Plasmodium falciparum TaxID=5833 RepID=A0A024XBY1_PLAFC|nr:hypothetical protein PFNF135_01520 [Plasmodium falciparum NF135/5.C10]ETW62698.1 hypothetical protein PFMC_01432 [Plasmodium falciparum CAMP/Malaysia]EUT89864.1 hypothetical protein PFAG_01372 [Plasmodium falciparum Santa Lucia]